MEKVEELLQDQEVLSWNIFPFPDICQGNWDTLFTYDISLGSRLYFPAKDEIMALWKWLDKKRQGVRTCISRLKKVGTTCSKTI